MRTLLKISYQHLPFTVHRLVPVRTQNKLYLLAWYRMGCRSITDCVCTCTRKPPCRKTTSVMWPWESTVWTFSDVDDCEVASFSLQCCRSIFWLFRFFFLPLKMQDVKDDEISNNFKFQFSNKGEEKMTEHKLQMRKWFLHRKMALAIRVIS